jgi:hypothetical protein
MPSGRKPGGKKTGGRKPGTPDKRTRAAYVKTSNRAEGIIALIESNHLETDIKKMSPSGRMYLMTQLMEFVSPKQSRVTSQAAVKQEVTVTIKRNRT